MCCCESGSRCGSSQELGGRYLPGRQQMGGDEVSFEFEALVRRPARVQHPGAFEAARLGEGAALPVIGEGNLPEMGHQPSAHRPAHRPATAPAQQPARGAGDDTIRSRSSSDC